MPVYTMCLYRIQIYVDKRKIIYIYIKHTTPYPSYCQYIYTSFYLYVYYTEALVLVLVGYTYSLKVIFDKRVMLVPTYYY